jgi:hypothetical protein
MTCSGTPPFFSSIRRSGDRSKLTGRALMMAMTVFSLNPARTSFTTEAFVSVAAAGPGPCARAVAPAATKTNTKLNRQVFILKTPQPLDRRNRGRIPLDSRQ